MWDEKLGEDVEEEPLKDLAYCEASTLGTLQALKKDNSKSNE
jgi:hypothetical protein